jgi:hypothetical protein
MITIVRKIISFIRTTIIIFKNNKSNYKNKFEKKYEIQLKITSY